MLCVCVLTELLLGLNSACESSLVRCVGWGVAEALPFVGEIAADYQPTNASSNCAPNPRPDQRATFAQHDAHPVNRAIGKRRDILFGCVG